MKITPDDPRLTAYALGELDAADRAAIELELQHSPECRHAVEQIQITAAQLTEDFRTEELPALTHAQQRAIRTQFTPARASTFSWSRLLFYGGAVAVAVLFIAMILPAKSLSMNKPRAMAQRSQSRMMANTSAPSVDGANPEMIATVTSVAAGAGDSAGTSLPTTIPQATSAGGKPSLSPQVALSTAKSGRENVQELNRYAPRSNPGNPSFVPALPEILSDGVSSSSKFQAGVDLLVRTELNTGLQQKPSLIAGRGFRDPDPNGARNDPYQTRLREARAETEQETLGKDASYEFRLRYGRESEPSTATFPKLVENSFLPVRQQPLSTFSIDVDTASYANVRRFLTAGQLPPHAAFASRK